MATTRQRVNATLSLAQLQALMDEVERHPDPTFTITARLTNGLAITVARDTHGQQP